MARYINADELRQDWLENGENEHVYDTNAFLESIDNTPAADVAPVVHGKWSHLGGDEFCCTNCAFVITTEGSWEKPTDKYCKHCGAKMDSEEKQ